LFVGDIRTPRKNLDTVLRALPSVSKLHVAVAGAVEGSPYPEMARQFGVEGRVHFLNKVSRIPDLMRSVDLFVFPSHYEAHPLVLLEAMASGLPSIVSGTFGAEDFIGSSGIILKDPDDAVELTRVLNDMLEDQTVLQSMARAGREQSLSMMWSKMAASYLAVYARFTAQKI
jgi:glycosyltransferase involved in cell wall biosynthesis